jgi:hypothetical protein
VNRQEWARFVALEERLARLEAALVAHGIELPEAPPPPAPNTAGEALPPVPIAPLPVPPTTSAASPEPRRNLETALGLTWISRIAVVTVVLALAFFFEYAFENHWITEIGRVLLGVGCGLAALAGGERFWRTGQRPFGQALTAAGVIFLYLSFWAAFALYHLISQPAAFVAMVAVTAVSGMLALRYEGQAVALLGLAGGFATPLLLQSSHMPWFVFAYAVLLNAAGLFAARKRNWRWVEALTLAGSVVLYCAELPPDPGLAGLYAAFVLVSYGLLASSPVPAVVGGVLISAGWGFERIWAPGWGGLIPAWLCAAGGLAVADRRGWASTAPAALAGFWLAYWAWPLSTEAPVGAVALLLTAVLVTFLAWPVWRACRRRLPLRTTDLLVLSLVSCFYFGALYSLLERPFGAWEGLFAVAVAMLEMSVARWLWHYDRRGGMLASGMAWVLLVLAAPLQFAGYRITVAWALEAAALTWIGSQLRARYSRVAALAVYGLVLVRLAFLDSRLYPNASGYVLLVNQRFLAFAVSAAALWMSARWMERDRWALVTYIAGHGVMLWGLCLEAEAWAVREAAAQDVRSVASTSISVVIAAYAVVLVAAGAYRRSAVTRILGMALIGMVVLKLYLYDVWLLGQFYRMAAFAILGVLLLVMSYLYSRFKESLENWWRP